jgi:uncharacterized protein
MPHATEKYQQVATDNHITIDDVARIAGQKLVARAPAGEWVRGIKRPIGLSET